MYSLRFIFYSNYRTRVLQKITNWSTLEQETFGLTVTSYSILYIFYYSPALKLNVLLENSIKIKTAVNFIKLDLSHLLMLLF